MNVSKKSQLQVYIHHRCEPGPEIDDHEFPLGRAPSEAINAFFTPSIKSDLLEDALPYEYDHSKQKIVHKTSLDHLDEKLLSLESRGKFDG